MGIITYYVIFCFGRGRKRATKNTTRIKEVVRKFAFYPASGRAGAWASRDLHHAQKITQCECRSDSQNQPMERDRKKIQLVPFRAQSALRCRTIETRNIISSLGKLLPHQWRKPYAKLSKLSLSFPLCIVYRLPGHKIRFIFRSPTFESHFNFRR